MEDAETGCTYGSLGTLESRRGLRFDSILLLCADCGKDGPCIGAQGRWIASCPREPAVDSQRQSGNQRLPAVRCMDRLDHAGFTKMRIFGQIRGRVHGRKWKPGSLQPAQDLIEIKRADQPRRMFSESFVLIRAT